jgi:hypothetical protein
VTVSPGATVQTTLKGQVWSTQNPTEIDQLIQYYSWNPLPPSTSTSSCLYNGVPGLYPGVSGTVSSSFIAPTSPGTYFVYISKTPAYTCAQGMSFITSYGYNGFLVGTITVSGSTRTTSTTITPSSLTVTHGTRFTLTVTVTDTSPGTATSPTGTVTWRVSWSAGSVSCTLVASGPGTSTCSVTGSAPAMIGVYTITATYNGDLTHNTSSGTSSLTVT